LALKREDRKILRQLKNQKAEDYGLICMSQDWQHPLLWGHYADKHRGFCLGFDVAKNRKFEPVEYYAERPTLEEFGRSTLAEFNANDIKRTIFMKFKAWDYESEYRAFCRLEEKDPVNDLYFLPFSKSLILAHVIVGERSSVTRDRLAGVLGRRKATVTSFKARPGFNRFEVVENHLKKAWRRI
jgi:Protein of unknown function (DUF2971)